MKKELTDLFKSNEISEAQNFNSIKISLFLKRSVNSFFIISLAPHLMLMILFL